MTNGELDYGQLLSNLNLTEYGWRPPSRSGACDFADGIDTRQLLSVGPACDPVYPGDSVPFVYALCGGSNLHTDPDLLFNCREPLPYVNSLDYTDLAFAATWASWVYDTPGIDSDGDNYSGAYHRLGGQRVYYSGDLGPPPAPGQRCISHAGAPDYTGPMAPGCPQAGRDLTIVTRPNEIIVRWNGRTAETTPDPLTNEIDFEGYGLYVSRENSPDEYSLVATWDRENWRRYIFWGNRWILDGDLMSGNELREMYGDDFQPGLYTVPSTGTCFRDTIDFRGFRMERCSYFESQAANRSNVYYEAGQEFVNIIQRIGDSTVIENGDTLTFGLYEARLTGLNPSHDLYVSVTAFDYGSPELRLDPMESLPGTCWEFAVPIYSADVVEDSGLGVSVYPNPYKIAFLDRHEQRTTYYDLGLESPGKPSLDETDRRIWFINLPSEATIRIYTLDGDLIRTIEHEWPRTSQDESFLTDYSSRAAWDLITRNTQAVVSGVYIYHIDSPIGSQVGKIVIVK
jgi:hypothetical protein